MTSADYLFSQLLANTRGALAADHTRANLDETIRNILILVTLGASLHTVQDFYSHSDWIHNDFDSTAVKMVRPDSGPMRAPTWFQVRERLRDPDNWPFRVKSGIYPPVAGVRDTHTHMNHDNSRLLYREDEPRVSRWSLKPNITRRAPYRRDPTRVFNQAPPEARGRHCARRQRRMGHAD